MTWIGLIAIVLFVVVSAAAALRPLLSEHDGPSRGVAEVNRPAVAP